MIKSLFPSSIYSAPLLNSPRGKLNQELRDESLKLRQIDDVGIAWSAKNYRGGYTSYGSMAALHQFSSTFADLQKALDKHVRKFARYLELDINPRQLQMRSCWVNIMPAGTLHSMHLHPLSVISGTYYVQTPKNCSALKFEDPRLSAFMASPPRKASAKERNQRFVEVTPSAGQVILFESWMKHEVPQSQITAERISISFNYDWV